MWYINSSFNTILSFTIKLIELDHHCILPLNVIGIVSFILLEIIRDSSVIQMSDAFKIYTSSFFRQILHGGLIRFMYKTREECCPRYVVVILTIWLKCKIDPLSFFRFHFSLLSFRFIQLRHFHQFLLKFFDKKNLENIFQSLIEFLIKKFWKKI